MSFNSRKSKSARQQRQVKKQLFMSPKGVSCSSGKRVFTTRNDAWQSLITRQNASTSKARAASGEDVERIELYKCASCGFWHHTYKRIKGTVS